MLSNEQEQKLVDILDRVIIEARKDGYSRAFEIRKTAFNEILKVIILTPLDDETLKGEL